jgi:beta-lactam-binding protein with PASTA domain
MRVRVVAVLMGAVLVLVGCTSGPEGEDPGTTPAKEWTMPDLVGATLQDAQDQMQDLTGGAVYFTDSHDLGGKDRNQVSDRNWQVCTQSVAAGETLTADSRVDFGVVKLEETCP